VTGSALTGLAAAFAFTVGDTVWTRAVRAEVHDVALFCSALALVAADRAGRTGSARPLPLAALACGLGLATHPITAFAVPCVLILAWPALRKANNGERFRALGAALAPLVLYAYFPLRSGYIAAHHLDPNDDLGLSGSALFDDGSPSSWAAFWRYVSGATFPPSASLPRIISWDGLSRALNLWHDVALREFSFDMLALAAIGIVYLTLRDRRLAAGLALVLIASVAFAANYRVETDSNRYALPGLWTLVACAAFGAHWIISGLLGGPSRWTGPLAAGILFVGLWPNAYVAFDDVRRTNVFNDASAIGSAIAAHSPDGTLFIATWNFATPLAYADYIDRSFGSRRLITGWPPDYAADVPAWRKRFGHVYYVVSSKYDAHKLGRSMYAQGRWQFGEVR
jgi:hypothetical protein